MIFLDTSVWIRYFRGQPKSIFDQVQNLLDTNEVVLAAPVRIEILSGTRKLELHRVDRLLSAFSLFHPTDYTWNLINTWLFRSASSQGFGFGDLLIAAIASENEGKIWSLDKDFKRMADLKLVQLFEPKKL